MEICILYQFVDNDNNVLDIENWISSFISIFQFPLQKNSVSHLWQGCFGIESLRNLHLSIFHLYISIWMYICSVPFVKIYLLEKENQKNNKTLDESNMNLCKSVLSWVSTSVQEVSWIIHLLKTVGVWGDDVAGWVSPVM